MAPDRKEQPKPANKKGTFQKLDEAYAESSMEDQLLVYWNRYKNQILLGVSLAVALVVGIQVSNWWSAKAAADRGEAYAAATGAAEKEAFADKFSKSELGGVAYLELADQAYTDGEFSKAVSFYEKAFKAFDSDIFKQRAHLGIAVARLKAGDSTVAIKDLESISKQNDYPEVARAEALYHLSILDWEKEDFEAMLEKHQSIEALPNAGNWLRKAFELQNTVPGLKKLAEAQASDGWAAENLQTGSAN